MAVKKRVVRPVREKPASGKKTGPGKKPLQKRKAFQMGEEVFRGIVEGSPIGVDVFDAKGRLAYANASGLSSFGASSLSDVEGFNFFYDPSIPEEVKRRLREGEAVRFESAFDFDRAGQSRLFKTERSVTVVLDMAVMPLKGPRGAIKGYVFQVQDITGRRRADEHLGQSERRFRGAFENLAVGASIVDLKGRFLKVNRFLCEMLGYTEEEMLSKTFSDVTHPEDVHIGLDALKKQVAGDADFMSFEKRYVRKDGGIIHVIISPALIRDSEGRPLHFVGLFQDITERRLAEDKLSSLNQTLEALIQYSPLAIACMDNSARVTIWNPAAERIFGWESQEVLGRPNPIIPEDKREEYLSLLQGVMQGKPYHSKQLRRKGKDGSPIYLNAASAAMYDSGGRVIGAMGIFEDYTERKLAEDALRRSEERYRALVEDQTELVNRFLPDGTVTYVNEALCRYFGRGREELIGRSFLPLVPDGERERLLEYFASFDRENPVGNIEHYVHMPGSGEVRWQSWTSRAIFDDAGRIVEFQGVGRDVTEKKEAELKLQRSLREKEVLLQEIHHRVKNNMQVISSLLSLKCRYIKDSETLEHLKDTRDRIRSMALIHERLYTTGSFADIDFKVYVESLIKGLIDSFGARAKGVEFELEVSGVSLNADTAIPCGLIINELVSNCLKHAFPQGRGRIRVSLRREDPEGFVLRVADDGVGIPGGLDFRKPDSLGLELVTLLTENQLAGSIELDNSSGTEFTLRFRGLSYKKRF